MPFFLFGTSYDSWAVGNDVWTTWSSNLDPSLKQLFENRTIRGGNIDWVSSGADGQIYMPYFPKVMGYGDFMVNKHNGASSVFRTQDPTLLVDTNPVRLDTCGLLTRTVEHISFSPGGGWIVAYSDGSLRVSITGTFPDSFHNTAAPYLVTKACMDSQQSAIKYVFFGAGDTFILQMKDRRMIAHEIPQALKPALITQHNRGFMLGKSTVLCPWDNRFFFACFEPREQCAAASSSYSWDIWPNEYLSNTVIGEVLDGVTPLYAETVTPFNEPPPDKEEQNKYQPVTASTRTPPLALQPKPSQGIPSVSKGVQKNPFRKQASEKNGVPDPSAYFSKEQIDNFRHHFHEMQTSLGSGKIDAESAAQFLTTCAKHIGDIAVSRLELIWDKIDKDKSGDLDLEEFMHGMVLLGRVKNGLDLEDDSTALQVTNMEEGHAYVPLDPPPAYSTLAAPSDTNRPEK